MAETKIEWTDAVWNPTRGCSRISPGCGGPHNEGGCYAERQAIRQAGPGGAYEGLVKSTPNGPRWTGLLRLAEDKLSEPLHWRTPRRVFVNSMSDLFHEKLSDEEIDHVFGVMFACEYLGKDARPGHVFQVLTKRVERMAQYMRQDRRREWARWAVWYGGGSDPDLLFDRIALLDRLHPRIWLGVSVEDQRSADERIPFLLSTPSAVRFLSCEPLLGPVSLEKVVAGGLAGVGIHWVIVGGESGPRSRPCDAAWVRRIVRECQRAKTRVFVKQMGSNVVDRNDAGFNGEDDGGWHTAVEYGGEIQVEHLDVGYQGAPVRVHLRNRKGGDPAEWPQDLAVREFPEART